jgi:hypothetical protein
MLVGQFLDFWTTKIGTEKGYTEKNPVLGVFGIDNPSVKNLVVIKAATIGIFVAFSFIWPDMKNFIFLVGAVVGFSAAGLNWLQLRKR